MAGRRAGYGVSDGVGACEADLAEELRLPPRLYRSLDLPLTEKVERVLHDGVRLMPPRDRAPPTDGA
ncbi:MAG: hypothetical protein WBY01_17280, partial [Pseudolabrys sp.]